MKKAASLFVLLCISASTRAQEVNDPLKPLEYYMGVWIPPKDHPMGKDPKMAHLQVINFEWGANRKLVRSTTGIHSQEYNIPFSEGTITYNPMSEKIVWLEYQYDGDLLFEGEYLSLENGGLQRIYTVYYAKEDKSIPNPQEAGSTRLYRETFTPLAADTIGWKTETYIGNEWIKAGSGGGFKAVRKID
ncbi:MAG: hypothetical protein ABJG78_19920 [Cyclobacteriaceae bacterium]